ncbi:MAG: serine/threonine protein kinase [Planctomycetota bacterium]|jgi:serine/threonine protein kinase
MTDESSQPEDGGSPRMPKPLSLLSSQRSEDDVAEARELSGSTLGSGSEDKQSEPSDVIADSAKPSGDDSEGIEQTLALEPKPVSAPRSDAPDIEPDDELEQTLALEPELHTRSAAPVSEDAAERTLALDVNDSALSGAGGPTEDIEQTLAIEPDQTALPVPAVRPDQQDEIEATIALEGSPAFPPVPRTAGDEGEQTLALEPDAATPPAPRVPTEHIEQTLQLGPDADFDANGSDFSPDADGEQTINVEPEPGFEGSSPNAGQHDPNSEVTLALDGQNAPAVSAKDTMIVDEETAATLAKAGQSGDQGETTDPTAPTVKVRRPMTPSTPSNAKDGYPQIQDVVIEDILGKGGQGTVYRGVQTYLDRAVAVKVLEGGTSSSFAMRFRREAKILAGMQHPHIVSCYQAGVDDAGQCFIVMEFISGPDLSQWIKKYGALPCNDALVLARDVAVALKYAHEASVIHRDVKPQNVLLQPHEDGGEASFPFQAKLADLGLARTSDSEVDITVPGSVMGTPSTMAVEQFDDPEAVDFRADIYGLGCVLYHSLAGKSAYGGKPMSAIFKLKATQPPPEVRDIALDVPASVNALVSRMMAATPDERHQSYDELIEAIESELQRPQTQDNEKPTRKLPVPALAGGAVAIALLLGWAFMGDGETPDPNTGTGQPAHSSADEEVAQSSEQSDKDASQANDTGTSTPLNTEASTEDAGASAPLEAPTEESSAPLAQELETDQQLALFEEWSEETDLLKGWTRNDTDATWGIVEADPSRIQCAGASGTATRWLPAGYWQLTGETYIRDNFGWKEGDPALGGMRFEFASGHQVEFRVAYGKSESTATWHLTPPAGGDPITPDLLEGMSTGSFPTKTYVQFTVHNLEGDLMVQIGDGKPWLMSHTLVSVLGGPPTQLTLFAKNCTMRWQTFVLKGL